MKNHTHPAPLLLLGLLAILIVGLWPQPSEAIPAFARKYNLSCVACHAAFPKLNEFGQDFVASNYRLPNWKIDTVETGDEMLALPKSIPLAIRAQAYVQTRQAKAIDVNTGATLAEADVDIQAPYLIKFLSSAPLSEHISYYFYGIFAEKGGNGSTIIEDAWFSHDDVFGTGAGMMLGQFQVSDLMFARETRLTFQDFMVYRMAGLTYDRGVVVDYTVGPVDLALGWVNGNGIEADRKINSPGYNRPDHLFDTDNNKALFGRVGSELGPVSAGLFAYSGSQKNALAPDQSGGRDTDKNAWGIDMSGKIGDKIGWFSQAIWNEWDGFIDANQKYRWFGAFVGIDCIHSPRWAYSALYNYADANDLKDTDTIYEGIEMNSMTFTASYYFMRNVKAIIEANVDLLETTEKTGTYWTGHLTNENYFLVGLDTAF